MNQNLRLTNELVEPTGLDASGAGVQAVATEQIPRSGKTLADWGLSDGQIALAGNFQLAGCFVGDDGCGGREV